MVDIPHRHAKSHRGDAPTDAVQPELQVKVMHEAAGRTTLDLFQQLTTPGTTCCPSPTPPGHGADRIPWASTVRYVNAPVPRLRWPSRRLRRIGRMGHKTGAGFCFSYAGQCRILQSNNGMLAKAAGVMANSIHQVEIWPNRPAR